MSYTLGLSTEGESSREEKREEMEQLSLQKGKSLKNSIFILCVLWRKTGLYTTSPLNKKKKKAKLVRH